MFFFRKFISKGRIKEKCFHKVFEALTKEFKKGFHNFIIFYILSFPICEIFFKDFSFFAKIKFFGSIGRNAIVVDFENSLLQWRKCSPFDCITCDGALSFLYSFKNSIYRQSEKQIFFISDKKTKTLSVNFSFFSVKFGAKNLADFLFQVLLKDYKKRKNLLEPFHELR